MGARKSCVRNLREKTLRARRKLGAESRAAASTIICDRVMNSREFRSATNIACYIPMNDEVDTRPIIARAWRANKRVFVPVTHHSGEMFFREIRTDTTLLRNRMSIWEPATGEIVAPRLLQLVVTPTVDVIADLLLAVLDPRVRQAMLGSGR